MALETGTYISDLVPTNPPTSDPLAQAANHLQLIKQTLHNTFPHITGVVNATHENLSNGTPVGLIAMWSGASVPTGWTLCNGVAVARADGTGNITPPDLRDRFIVGSGGSYSIGATGGVATQTSVASHSHGLNDPGHVHGLSDPGHGHGVNDPGHSHSQILISGSGIGGSYFGNGTNNFSGGGSGSFGWGGTPFGTNSATTGIGIAAGGSNISVQGAGTNMSVQAAGTAGGVENRPPYFALAYIMKV